MFIVTPAIVEVKPATAADVFPLALRDVYQEIEADARDLADEMTEEDRQAAEDDYWAAMDEATLERMAGEAHYTDLTDSGLIPWRPGTGGLASGGAPLPRRPRRRASR